MDNKLSHERILICVALIACACVIGYNAFFTPKVSVPTVIYTDQDSLASEDEEYSPQTVPAMAEEDSSAVSVDDDTSSAASVDNDTSSAVPVNEDTLSAVSSAPSNSAVNSSGLININTASAEELEENLPRVGNVIAARIIDYREFHGGFKSIDEIMEVSGIGDKIFEGIKDKICVN